MADSQGSGRTSETVGIPGSGSGAALSDPSSGFITPQGKSCLLRSADVIRVRFFMAADRQVMSSSPYTESPTSFHTADQPDNDYQQDINEVSLRRH